MKLSDKLRAYWSKKENDVMLHWPAGASTISDGRWLSSIFNNEFIKELKNRGYDPKTIKFSVEPQKNNERFVSQRKSNTQEQ